MCCVVGCSAGSHDENYISLCEKFVTAKEKGSIASFCSTVLMGWTPGMYLQRKLNDEILAATEVKTIGELFKTSVQIDDFKNSDDFFHYHILGDPATRFVLTLPETRNFIYSVNSNINELTPNEPVANLTLKFNRSVNIDETYLSEIFEANYELNNNGETSEIYYPSSFKNLVQSTTNTKEYFLDFQRASFGALNIDDEVIIKMNRNDNFTDIYGNKVDESNLITLNVNFIGFTLELTLREFNNYKYNSVDIQPIYKFGESITIVATFSTEITEAPTAAVYYGEDNENNDFNLTMRKPTDDEIAETGYGLNTYIYIYEVPDNLSGELTVGIMDGDNIKDVNGNTLITEDSQGVDITELGTILIDSVKPGVNVIYDLVKNVYIPGENIEITAQFTKNMQYTEQNKPTISFTKGGVTIISNMEQVSEGDLTEFKYTYTVQEVTTRGNIDILIRGKDIVGNEVEFTNIIDVCSECVIVNISYDKDTFYKQGETVLIEATFNDNLSESPLIKITGEKIIESPQTMTKKDDHTYIYNYTIPRNIGGQVIVSFENVKKEINGKILEIISDNIEKSGAIFMVTPSLISYSIDKTKFTPKSREAVLTLTFTNSVTFTTSDIFAIYGRFFNIIKVDDYTYNVSYLAPLGLQQDVEILIMGTYFDIVGNTGPSSTDLNLHLFVKVNTFEPPCVKLANCCSCTPKVIVKKNTVMDIQGSNTSRAMRLAAALASGKKSTLRAIVSRNC